MFGITKWIQITTNYRIKTDLVYNHNIYNKNKKNVKFLIIEANKYLPNILVEKLNKLIVSYFAFMYSFFILDAIWLSVLWIYCRWNYSTIRSFY